MHVLSTSSPSPKQCSTTAVIILMVPIRQALVCLNLHWMFVLYLNGWCQLEESENGGIEASPDLMLQIPYPHVKATDWHR